ncbi:reverse transcriptase [Tanacetum coccineum]
MTKVDFSKFFSDDVWGWIFRCEQFFLIDPIAEDQNRFGTVFDDPMAELKNVKYDNNAKEYHDKIDYMLSKEEFVDADDSLEDMKTHGVQLQISLNALIRMSSFQTLRVVRIKTKCPLSVIVAEGRPLVSMEFVYNQKKIALRDTHKTVVHWVDVDTKRTHEHRIPLVDGVPPVNIRPYKYPPTQKDAIEAMVRELLEAGLNKYTVKDKFPILVTDELVDELHRAVVFSKLDLRLGYHYIRMFEDDIANTPFKTDEGHYEFLVMPFRLTNTPFTFQALLIKDFASLSRPLTQLLKKNSYKWSEEAQSAFLTLKATMSMEPLLALHDFNVPFEVETDTLGIGIGSVLQQRGYFIAYLSGHSEVKVTTHKLFPVLYWKGMIEEIKKFENECFTCQRYKPDLAAYLGLLQPLHLPDRIWESISMDFIEGLPKSRRKELFQLLQVKLLMSTAYHLQTNGQTEEVYGQTSPANVLYLGGLSKVHVVDRTLEAREQAIQMLKFHLERSQNRMKQHANKKRSNRVLKVGDWAFLKLQPHRQLKLCKGTPPASQVIDLPSCDQSGLLALEPIAILDRNILKKFPIFSTHSRG